MCYTCCGVVLHCTWVLCCGAWCRMLCFTLHSYCNPYTPPHQTGRTPVNTITTKNTKAIPSPLGDWCTLWHTQGITDRSYWGPGYLLGSALSLCIPHEISGCYNGWPRYNIQGAQHINTNSNNNIIVTHRCPFTILKCLISIF